MSAWIKALGNVNQVGLQFFYATTEAKVTVAIGTEQLVNVNSSNFTIGQLVAQALGSSMTTSGVVGVRIRITGVSAGNLYDLNNGFIVEQAMVNAGTTAASFSRAGRNTQEEFIMCQRYYWIQAAAGVGLTGPAYSTTQIYITGRNPVRMRVPPNVVGTTGTYAINIGVGGNFLSTSVTPSFVGTDVDGFIVSIGGFTGLTTNSFYQQTFAGSPTGRIYADSEI